MRSAVRITERKRTVLRDFLSVPKTMGIGPIIIAPPALTFPVFLLLESKMSAAAIMMISIPAKTKAVPRL